MDHMIVRKTVLKFLETFPHLHNQDYFGRKILCEGRLPRISVCVGGAACLLFGETEWAESGWSGDVSHLIPLDAGAYSDGVEQMAADLLGLDDWQKDLLFYRMKNQKALDYLREISNG